MSAQRNKVSSLGYLIFNAYAFLPIKTRINKNISPITTSPAKIIATIAALVIFVD